jgi:hypothetical protein
MADRDLQLNGLHIKSSSRLVLEQHSHCEVPAGCGGVVLRWRAGEDVAVEFWTFSNGKVALSIDGEGLETSRAVLKPGPHVLGCRVTAVPQDGGFLMIAGVVGDHRHVREVVGPRRETYAPVLTLPDGSWKCAPFGPLAKGWHQPGFDDRGWPEMREVPVREEDGDDYQRWSRTKVAGFGAQPLGIRGDLLVEIRKVFVLPGPGEQT